MSSAGAKLKKQAVSVKEIRVDIEAHTGIGDLRMQIAALRKQIEAMSNRDDDLQKMLLAVSTERDELQNLLLKANRDRDELYRRNEDMYAALYALHAKVAALERNGSNHGRDQAVDPQGKVTKYQQLVRRIQEVVRASLPRDSTVLVAAKGDDDLLRLYGRRAWHFPQTANGVYAGYHPPNSTTAIVHMEALRARGADYLLLPNTMLWWLDYYVEFKRYLETYYRVVVRQDDVCLIFALRESDTSISPGWQSLFDETIASCQSRFGQKPSILDWNTGVNLAAKFPELTIFSPLETDRLLPYIDESVDIVAVASWDFISRSEAQRVAKAAVMKFSQSRNGSAHGPALEIEWKRGVPSATEKLTSSIVIPCCNNPAETETWLAALRHTLRGSTGEIILVNTVSTDDVADGLQRLARSDRRVKIARNRKGTGFLAACNCGAKAATGDILIFLNSAVLPLAGWLTPLLQIFGEYPNAGAAGGKHIYPDGRLQEAGGIVFSDGSVASFGDSDSQVDAPLYSFVREVDYCSITFLATRRVLFEELNGFEADFSSLEYGSADYGLRIRQKGGNVYYQPESAVTHVERHSEVTPSSGRNEDDQGRSRDMLIRRWADTLKQHPALPVQFDFGTWQDLSAQY